MYMFVHHMVILRTRNKITDFFMILAWASPFKYTLLSLIITGTLTVWPSMYINSTGA